MNLGQWFELSIASGKFVYMEFRQALGKFHFFFLVISVAKLFYWNVALKCIDTKFIIFYVLTSTSVYFISGKYFFTILSVYNYKSLRSEQFSFGEIASY